MGKIVGASWYSRSNQLVSPSTNLPRSSINDSTIIRIFRPTVVPSYRDIRLQSRIKLLEARFTNKLIGPSLASDMMSSFSCLAMPIDVGIPSVEFYSEGMSIPALSH